MVSLYNGYVADTAAAVTDLVRVSVPNLTILDRITFGPLSWTPRIASNGSVIAPSRGDAVLIAVDSESPGEQWIVSWEGNHSIGSIIAPTDGAVDVPSLRTLGPGALQAMPGNRIQDPSMPSAAKLQTMPRSLAVDDLTMAGSGTLQLALIGTLLKGLSYSFISFITGATAGAGLTHRWGALVRVSDLKIVAISADNVTATMSANTFQQYTFTAAYAPTADEQVMAAIMIAGTTPPTLRGKAGNLQLLNNVTPKLAVTADTGLTTPPAVGSTIAALTSITNMLWSYTG